MKNTISIFILFISICFSQVSCEKNPVKKSINLNEVSNFQELKDISEFSFVLMNDNVGDSLEASEENAKMIKWMAEYDDQFAIGVGDHVKKDLNNSFLELVKEDNWWNQNFYPNIAGQENEFFGEGRDDWGAGRQLLNDMNFSQHTNVEMRDNGCEYYAKISVKGYTIHLIQVHFPDSPSDDKVAFPEDSRLYLLDKLKSIDKKSKDIIIVSTHARSGHWIDNIGNRDLKVTLLMKCDLVLCATSSSFWRKSYGGYEPLGAVLLNTGSVTHGNKGYVHVSVIEDPMRLVIQYVNTHNDEMELQDGRVYLKYVGGLITRTRFSD